MARMVKVTRTVVSEYAVPVSQYDPMTEEEIRLWEMGDIDPGLLLDTVVSETTDVEFFDLDN